MTERTAESTYSTPISNCERTAWSNAFVDPKIPQKFAPYGIQTGTACAGRCKRFGSPHGFDKAQSGFVAHVHSGRQPISEFALMERFIRPGGRRSGSGRFWADEQCAPDSPTTLPRTHQRLLIRKAARSSARCAIATGKAIEIDESGPFSSARAARGLERQPQSLFFTAGNNNYADGTFGRNHLRP